ncbi:MAG: TIR domain-containing protein [Zavarzinia sp.]
MAFSYSGPFVAPCCEFVESGVHGFAESFQDFHRPPNWRLLFAVVQSYGTNFGLLCFANRLFADEGGGQPATLGGIMGKKFDVALSFSGYQRDEASALYQELKKLNLSVYYDIEHPEMAMGAKLTEILPSIYKSECKRCIVFVSKNYVEGYPAVEWAAIKERAHHEPGFFQPIRFDDSFLPGLEADQFYLNWNPQKIQEIANLIYGWVHEITTLRAELSAATSSGGPQTWISRLEKYVKRNQFGEIRTILAGRDSGNVAYNLACAYSVLAKSQRRRSIRKSLVTIAKSYFIFWLSNPSHFGPLNLEAAAEFANSDGHLDFFRKKCANDLNHFYAEAGIKIRVTQTAVGGGQCFLPETMVDTPNGPRQASDFKIGDELISINQSGFVITTRVFAVARSTVDCVIEINGRLTCTPEHRLLVDGRGWVSGTDLAVGQALVCSGPEDELVKSIKRIDKKHQVIKITTDHPSHNLFTSGYLSHNIKF